ncbi:MAG: ion channel [Cyanobacteria bacterium P01_H01_bin.105]
MTSLHKPHSLKYRQLLAVLVITFLASPFLTGGLGGILSTLLLFYTMIVIVMSLQLPKLWVGGYVAISTTAFTIQISSTMGWIDDFSQTLSLFPQVIFALYFGAAIYWIGRDIFTTRTVTADTVLGGISVYLMIGYLWAFLYGIVTTLNGDAFSQTLLIDGSYLKVFHFSFTTLTTLGYGDIVPISNVALVLTNLEAITGQMYSTVLIAILVGGYLSRSTEK